MNAKTVTLRLAPGAYERAIALAERRGESLNRLFQEGLRFLDEQERERQLFEDFSAIGDAGAEVTDVGFALAAQSEITTLP